MRRLLLLVLLSGLLICSISPAANADNLFKYSGPKFTTFVSDPADPLPDGVTGLTGWLTLAGPLGAGFNGKIVPLDFSFTDGATTINNQNALGFSGQFVTDTHGTLIDWTIAAWIETPIAGWIGGVPVLEFTIDGPALPAGPAGDDKTSYFNGNSFASTNAVGSWSTPEPSPLILLAMGLAALICGWRLQPLRGSSR